MTDIGRACTVYLNRACPRNCPSCANKRPGMKTLSGQEWAIAFDILNGAFKTDFFLILGIEPLLMPFDDLKYIVHHLNHKQYGYAFYTTAPQPLHQKLKMLIDRSKLRNVSCGIDVDPFRALIGEAKDKALNSVRLLDIAAVMKVPELHATITISRDNIDGVPDLIRLLANRYGKRFHTALNYVEQGGGDMDFAPHDYPGCFTEEDRPRLEAFARAMRKTYDDYGHVIQTPLEYFEDVDSIIRMDKPCGLAIPCIEADGTMRKCGYRTGSLPDFKVFDLKDPGIRIGYESILLNEVEHCAGCYWSYPYMLRANPELVDYRSNAWKVKALGNEGTNES